MIVEYFVKPCGLFGVLSKLPRAICGTILTTQAEAPPELPVPPWPPPLVGVQAVVEPPPPPPPPVPPVCPSTTTPESRPLLHSTALKTKAAKTNVAATANTPVLIIRLFKFIQASLTWPCIVRKRSVRGNNKLLYPRDLL